MPPDPADHLLDRPLLRQLAGEKVFARGEGYFAEGRVRQLQARPDRAVARVEGSRAYRVRLWQSRNELQWSCTCPLGREATFCKHAVAVGLAWLAVATSTEGEAATPKPRQEDERRRERIHQHLHGIPPERLIALLLEATDYDDILRRRLLLESIGVVRTTKNKRPSRASAAPDLDTYRQVLREAIETHDYVDYDALPDYAQGVEEAIYPLGELLEMGQAAAVVELAEFALIELDKASEMLDGSDGSLNRVYDSLQNFHLEACRLARPDPVPLAARLLAYELDGGLGVFNNALKTYAEVLGPLGTATWRALLTAQWQAVVQTPSSWRVGGEAEPIDHRRYQLQALMENLAMAEGDVEALIAIKGSDLRSPHDYLALAELCRSAGRHPAALAWAERGMRQFPHDQDAAGLRDFTVAELHYAGRDGEALAMVWKDFTRTANLDQFRRLKTQSQHVAGAWPVYRERALDHLRKGVKKARRPAKKLRWLPSPDASAIVEIFLDEGAVDEAWIEAQSGGCSPGLWLRLAARREQSHPADALGVYRSRLEPTLARGGQTAYKEAVELMQKMRNVLTGMGRAAEFTAYRDEVRAAHGRKRSFLRLLDAVEL